MITLASYLLTALAVVLAVPSAVFSIEILAAIFLARRLETPATAGADRRGRIAVLIPAHDESSGLLPTLEDIKAQLRPTDRLLVVADNCTDDTAAIAASAGAEVTVRPDLTKIGKGYALDWGLNYLASDPPDIVVMVDADCRVALGTLDRLAATCEQTQRPVQSLYLMTAPAESKVNHKVAEFAWRLKNWVRPLGLNALGLPCQLMGSGMAFPWTIIRSIELSTGSIVEDLKLGLDLAREGHAPLFCPSALVTSTFPSSIRGARAQRRRWENGHVGLILNEFPGLLYAAIKRKDLNLVALIMDLVVPPISLLGLMLLAGWFGSAVATLFGVRSYTTITAASLMIIVVTAILVAWRGYGRSVLPLKSLVLIVPYFANRILQHVTSTRGQGGISKWIRADRS